MSTGNSSPEESLADLNWRIAEAAMRSTARPPINRHAGDGIRG